MTADKFHDALTLLPSDLIAEADAVRSSRPKVLPLRRYAAMAARNLYLAVGKPNSSAAIRRIASRFIVKKAALAVGITR